MARTKKWWSMIGIDVLATLAEAGDIRATIKKRGKEFIDPGGYNCSVYKGGGGSRHWWEPTLKKARRSVKREVMDYYRDTMAQRAAERQRNIAIRDISRWSDQSKREAEADIAKRKPWKEP